MDRSIAISCIEDIDILITVRDKGECRLTIVDPCSHVRIPDASLHKCISLFSALKVTLENEYLPEYHHKQSIKSDTLDPYNLTPYDIYFSGRNNDVVCFSLGDTSFALHLSNKKATCAELQKLINQLYRSL